MKVLSYAGDIRILLNLCKKYFVKKQYLSQASSILSFESSICTSNEINNLQSDFHLVEWVYM